MRSPWSWLADDGSQSGPKASALVTDQAVDRRHARVALHLRIVFQLVAEALQRGIGRL